MVSPKRLSWEHRNRAPAVTGVQLCSQRRHTDAQPWVCTHSLSSSREIHTLGTAGKPCKANPSCLGWNTALLLNSELNLGTSLRFQFGFVSEVDGLRRTRTKPWSPSHGSCSIEVILLTKLFHEWSKLWFR